MSSENDTQDGGSYSTAVIAPSHVFRPTTRPTFQIRARLGEAESGDAFREAVEVATSWLSRQWVQRTGKKLPSTVGSFQDFEDEAPGHYKVQTIGLESEGLWTSRFDHPDLPFRGGAAVPGRSWSTEVVFRRMGNSVEFGLRCLCTSHQFSQASISLTRPGLVLEIDRRFGLYEARRLPGEPWMMESSEDLEELEEYLTSRDRSVPVIILTEPDHTKVAVEVSRYVLNPNWLARQVQGFGVVVCLPYSLAFEWTMRVGKPWSVYMGAVRTYLPGLNFEVDAPENHPLAVLDRILFWKNGDQMGEREYGRFLRYMTLRYAAYRRIDWEPLKFLSEAKQVRARLLLQHATEETDQKTRYEQEIASLREQFAGLNEQLEEQKRELNQWVFEMELAQKAQDIAEAEAAKLRYANDSLRQQLEAKNGASPDEEIPDPDGYDELADWVEKHFAGRLKMHSRAVRALKDAVYAEFSLVCQALRLLAVEYRNMRRGVENGRFSWEKRLRELELELEGAVSQVSAGKYEDDYKVLDPWGGGTKKAFEHHLAKGNSRDARYCLRVYFYWDNDHEQCVVGWLPSHLTTTTS